jgi:iduronate 2-sulfatase
MSDATRRSVLGALRNALLASAMGLTTAACATAGSNAQASATPAPGLTQRMNVLFLIADDLNASGAFGSREVRTPNIDRLAERGVRFQQAYSQFPLCGPSRASLLTGLRPNTVRVYDLQTTVRANAPDVVTLPQHFRQNGYVTARVGKLFHQGVPGDIGRQPDPHDDPASWDVAINPSGRDKQAEKEGRIRTLGKTLSPGVDFAYLADEGADEEQTDGLVATRTIELIEQHKDAPFFIAAGFYRPHVPEVAPKKYFEAYPQVRYRPESQEHRDQVLPASKGPPYLRSLSASLTPEEQATFVRAYYAATSFLDAQVGRVLDRLENSGVADRTIVVFTSDHGYNLGEHGGWQKQMLWDQSTRAPLVVYVPGAKGNGRSSRRIVELLDLYPTLADLAGTPKPAQVEGRSLRPLLNGPDDRSWNYPALSQVGDGRSVRFETWRYSEWGKDGAKGVELYDLASDPGEYRNLAGDPARKDVIARLKAMLPGDPPPSLGPKIKGGE